MEVEGVSETPLGDFDMAWLFNLTTDQMARRHKIVTLTLLTFAALC